MEFLEKLYLVLLSTNTVELSTSTISFFGVLITFLLGIIAYFVKSQLTEQKQFNINNTKEHAQINHQLTITTERLSQIAKNEENIITLDKRVNHHDIKINELNTKLNPYTGKSPPLPDINQ